MITNLETIMGETRRNHPRALTRQADLQRQAQRLRRLEAELRDVWDEKAELAKELEDAREALAWKEWLLQEARRKLTLTPPAGEPCPFESPSAELQALGARIAGD